MPDSVPDDVRRLLEERADARSRRDWTQADAIRDRIAALGWEVQDTEGQPRRGRSSCARPRPGSDRPTGEVDASVQLTCEDHPDDLGRLPARPRRTPPSSRWELVIVANAPAEPVATTLGAAALPVEPLSSESDGRLGWADSRTLGLRHSRGEVTILLDTSLEPTGDFLARSWRPSTIERSASRAAGASRAPTLVSSTRRRRDPWMRWRPTALQSGERHCARSAASIAASATTAMPTSNLVLGARCRLDGRPDRSCCRWSTTSIGAGRRFPTPNAIGSASATSTASWTDGETVPTSCSIRSPDR